MTFRAMIVRQGLLASRRKPVFNGAAMSRGGFDSSAINRFGALRCSATGHRRDNPAVATVPRNHAVVRLIHREIEIWNFVLFPANGDAILTPRFLKAV
jgi:hypothetical protein